MISLIDYIKEQLMLEHGGVVPMPHNLAKEISKQLENEIENQIVVHLFIITQMQKKMN